jgi:phage shock protein PspC (stress-responsive transcriptional regulator)
MSRSSSVSSSSICSRSVFGAPADMAAPLVWLKFRVLTGIFLMSVRPRSGHDRAMTEPNINPGKRLSRTREGRVVAGVCGGIAAYFGIDPTLVRLAFAVFTIFGGAGVLIYLIAWIVIPEEGGDGSSIAESFVSKRRS